AGARNAGIRAAKGEWIAFLDDDDEMLPRHLEQAHDVLRQVHDEVGFAWSGIEHVREELGRQVVLRRGVWQPQFESREHAYLSMLRGRRVGTSTGFMVRRSVALEIGGFDERFRAAVDADFIIRLARCSDFVVLPEVTMRMHHHSGERVRRNHGALADAYA